MQLDSENLLLTTNDLLLFMLSIHRVKTVQIRSYFWSVFSCIRTEYGDLQISVFSPNTGKYRPEITPHKSHTSI